MANLTWRVCGRLARLGALLQEIRRNGPEQELIDAVVDLSLRYGIVTPYTSAYAPEPAGEAGVETRGAPTTGGLVRFV
ncbi:MAG: hypothetical protein R2932_37980 [Caldilineaceae bacterium]